MGGKWRFLFVCSFSLSVAFLALGKGTRQCPGKFRCWVPPLGWLCQYLADSLAPLGVSGGAGTWCEHVSPNCLLPCLPHMVWWQSYFESKMNQFLSPSCFIFSRSSPRNVVYLFEQQIFSVCSSKKVFHWCWEGSGVACSRNPLGLPAGGYKAFLSYLMAFLAKKWAASLPW